MPETLRLIRADAVAQHGAALAEGVRMAAREGATLVCLQELTLSPYFATSPDGPAAAGAMPEEIPDGPTCRFAAALARETGAHVHASLYERAEAPDVLGFNTAGGAGPRRVAGRPHAQDAHPGRRRLPRGSLLPPGAGGRRHAGRRGGEGRFGFPTCWDQWFPELARAYSLAGAEVLVYPTAIGSEPDPPDFDTEPLWEQVMIANGTFMIAVNRIGEEPPGGAAAGHVAGAAVAPTRVTFYGSLFISDPYGRKLVQAPATSPPSSSPTSTRPAPRLAGPVRLHVHAAPGGLRDAGVSDRRRRGARAARPA